MLITPLSWKYIEAFSFYEKGYLPNDRGWVNESRKYIQAMMLLGSQFDKVAKEKSDGTGKSKARRTS
jgi:hypothetical protein